VKTSIRNHWFIYRPIRFLWRTPSCWLLVFSFSSNGNIFASLGKAKFWLSHGCNKTVWRPRDRRFDDRYTAASVNPPPSTVNTSPTHTKTVVYTLNIKNIQEKHYFKAKHKSLKDFCLFDFAEMYKRSYFLPMTVALYHHGGYAGK